MRCANADLPFGWRQAVDSTVAFRVAGFIASVVSPVKPPDERRLAIAPETLEAIRNDALSVLDDAMTIGREEIGICSCDHRPCICREEVILALCASKYARMAGKDPNILGRAWIAQFRAFKRSLS